MRWIGLTYHPVVERMFEEHQRLSLWDVFCAIPALALILRHVDVPLDDIMVHSRLVTSTVSTPQASMQLRTHRGIIKRDEGGGQVVEVC